MSRRDLPKGQSVTYSYLMKGREIQYEYRQAENSIRLLVMPPLAKLYSGLPDSARCEELQDTETYLAAMIATPINYLAIAFPDGPGSVEISEDKQISVKPGRLYIDPGNHINVKRPLEITMTVQPDSEIDGISFTIVEQAEAENTSDLSVTYDGYLGNYEQASLAKDEESLSSWLICPWGEYDPSIDDTLGDLRERAAFAGK